MDHCVHPHHQGAPSSVPTSNSAHTHSQLMTEADQQVAGTNEIAYQSVASAPTAALVEMLSRIDALEAIPRLQVEDQNSEALRQDATSSAITQLSPCSVDPVALSSGPIPLINNPVQLNPAVVGGVDVTSLAPVTSEVPTVVSTITILPQSSSPEASESEMKRSRVGRPRTKPQKEKTEWHQHLGGVRHCRVPLTPELREVLEVAYVSKIMSKNFRKEGQPEKERIARITGMDIDKVQEWFKNRRKKDKLHKDRTQPRKRGRPSNTTSSGTTTAATKEELAETLEQCLTSQSPHAVVEIDTRSLLSQLPQQAIVSETEHLSSTSLTPTCTVATIGSGNDLQSSDMETVAGHELQVASSIELTM